MPRARTRNRFQSLVLRLADVLDKSIYGSFGSVRSRCTGVWLKRDRQARGYFQPAGSKRRGASRLNALCVRASLIVGVSSLRRPATKP